MAVRFRIRTSQGQELTFASHEMFEEFVRSGDLAPDDLVYDGETTEWAPARTHPLVLEIEYEKDEAAEKAAEDAGEAPRTAEDLGLSLAAPPAASATPAHEGVGASGSEGSFGLDLAPAVPEQSAEEANKKFVDRMASERAMDAAFGTDIPSAPMAGIRMEDSSVLADMSRAEPKPEPRPRPARPEPPARIKVARPKPKRTGRKVAAAVVALGVLGAGGYFGVGLLGAPEPGNPVDSLVVPTDPPTDPEPPRTVAVIEATEEAVRERARERFLSAAQTQLAELDPIPAAWLRGEYFALPSDYDGVRQVWQEYSTTIRTVRTGDAERYRTAYESALDDAGVTGAEERTRRLAAATAAFAPKVEVARAHWDRVEALATAALQSHTALLGAEGLILYDASGTTGRAGGIGAGTSGRDSDTQLLLDQVVELVGRVLLADGQGPREGANVREWVWGGFLDAVTR